MDQQTKAHVNSLLEDGWFFGNTLANNQARSTSKMVRCFSDPCPCSSSKQEISVSSQNQSNPKMMNNLLRTPSLPPSWGSREMKFSQDEERDEEEEEEDEPSMGDLIRQAMPLPMPKPKPNLRRLDRTPSLPPCRSKVGTGSSGVPSTQNGPNGVGRLTRRASIDSSVLLPENGPNGMAKLSRRASIDSPMVLPPKYTSKGTKQGGSNTTKNRPQRKIDLPNITIGPTKDNKISTQNQNQNLNKSKFQKSLIDPEIEELGFSFDNKQVISPSVAHVIPALQRRASIDSSSSSFNGNGNGKVRRPSLAEAWQRTQSSSPLSAPPIPKRGDQKAQSAEDMKAQLKFWARAVASNVRQEC